MKLRSSLLDLHAKVGWKRYYLSEKEAEVPDWAGTSKFA